MGADLFQLGGRRPDTLRGQPPLQIQRRDVHRQRGLHQRAGLRLGPAEALTHQPGDQRAVHRVGERVDGQPLGVLAHRQVERDVGVAVGQGDDLLDQVVHAGGEARLVGAAQHPVELPQQAFPEREQAERSLVRLGFGTLGRSTNLLDVDEGSAFEQRFELVEVGDHVPAREQQLPLRIAHPPRQRLAEADLALHEFQQLHARLSLEWLPADHGGPTGWLTKYPPRGGQGQSGVASRSAMDPCSLSARARRSRWRVPSARSTSTLTLRPSAVAVDHIDCIRVVSPT